MTRMVRKGDRVLFAAWRDSHVLAGTVLHGRRNQRGEVLVQADEGAKYWREQRNLLVLP